MKDYLKSLKDWCKLKIGLSEKESTVVFKQGDRWWCSLGMNLGEEIYGKGSKFRRPVLIFRKLTGNSLNQARIMDKKRLTSRIVALDEKDIKNVRDRFVDFYSA